MLYVAISRFRSADDLLILQPFDVEVLQQGEPPQAAFLLEHLELMATQKKDEARQQGGGNVGGGKREAAVSERGPQRDGEMRHMRGTQDQRRVQVPPVAKQEEETTDV